MKKILILGATGAMATYLIPELLNEGHTVVGVALDDAVVSGENYTHIIANAMDLDFLSAELAKGYDGIVDFMIYKSKELFEKYYKLFLDNCEHYIFLSTYRVYAGSYPIKEESPRLLDVEKPDDFVYDFEYSIYKAESENLLMASDYNNFTIVRPAITYSKRKFQLTTLEAGTVVARMLAGKPLVLPESAMDCEATMSWAGDVAKMLKAILFNKKAMREAYTLSTAEHHTWRDIADIYARIGGLKYVTASAEDFINIVCGDGEKAYSYQQLKYDRCFNRIVDNSKILKLAGMSQEDLMPLEDGLAKELAALPEGAIYPSEAVCRRMDEYLMKIGKN